MTGWSSAPVPPAQGSGGAPGPVVPGAVTLAFLAATLAFNLFAAPIAGWALLCRLGACASLADREWTAAKRRLGYSAWLDSMALLVWAPLLINMWAPIMSGHLSGVVFVAGVIGVAASWASWVAVSRHERRFRTEWGERFSRSLRERRKKEDEASESHGNSSAPSYEDAARPPPVQQLFDIELVALREDLLAVQTYEPRRALRDARKRTNGARLDTAPPGDRDQPSDGAEPQPPARPGSDPMFWSDDATEEDEAAPGGDGPDGETPDGPDAAAPSTPPDTAEPLPDARPGRNQPSDTRDRA